MSFESEIEKENDGNDVVLSIWWSLTIYEWADVERLLHGARAFSGSPEIKSELRLLHLIAGRHSINDTPRSIYGVKK